MCSGVLHAIPGQACPRNARAHAFEDGANEGPFATKSAENLGVAALHRNLASSRAHGKDGARTCRA
eukprot:6240518-Pyramimonas_sp.AAC.1